MNFFQFSRHLSDPPRCCHSISSSELLREIRLSSVLAALRGCTLEFPYFKIKFRLYLDSITLEHSMTCHRTSMNRYLIKIILRRAKELVNAVETIVKHEIKAKNFAELDHQWLCSAIWDSYSTHAHSSKSNQRRRGIFNRRDSVIMTRRLCMHIRHNSGRDNSKQIQIWNLLDSWDILDDKISTNSIRDLHTFLITLRDIWWFNFFC